MDSLSQFALGAACGVAALGRRTPVWKAALIGGLCGTLPDLDAFIDHGDPVSNMTLHRANSHALLWLTLASAPLAWLVSRLPGEAAHFRRWWLAVWLALFTHPLLDLTTIYGTQLARPFTDWPYAIGSMFIIDPLYTVPLLVGLGVALARRGHAGLRWNAGGLLLSTAYLGWSMVAQQAVTAEASRALAAQGLPHERLLVTPTPLNTVLWRVVSMGPDGTHEGYRSLLDDRDVPMRFTHHPAGRELAATIGTLAPVQRMAWFTQGWYRLERRGDSLRVTDLRMGQEPTYTFSFAVARIDGDRTVPLDKPEAVGGRPELGPALQWLWRRLRGEQIDPPR